MTDQGEQILEAIERRFGIESQSITAYPFGRARPYISHKWSVESSHKDYKHVLNAKIEEDTLIIAGAEFCLSDPDLDENIEASLKQYRQTRSIAEKNATGPPIAEVAERYGLKEKVPNLMYCGAVNGTSIKFYRNEAGIVVIGEGNEVVDIDDPELYSKIDQILGL